MTDNASEGIELTLSQVARIGRSDLLCVIEHRIEEHFGSVSHYVRFRQGGTLYFARSLSGELLELSGEGLSFQINREGDVLVGPFEPLASQASPS